jgi:hypothetical protein
MGSFIAFIQAVPALISLFNNVIGGFKGLMAFIADRQHQKRVLSASEAFSKLAKAKTQEERKDAVSDIADAIGDLN